MIIDVHLKNYDDNFIDNIEEIMEETNVQMFVLHPKDADALKEVQELTDEHHNIFYTVPVELADNTDKKCVAVYISTIQELESVKKDVVMIEEDNLDETLYKALYKHKGIILNATKSYDHLKNFFVSISPSSVDQFDNDVLNKLSMKKLVLQSNYPAHDFDDLFTTVEKISNSMFRSEQSIMLEASKNTLQLFGFKIM
ncbi:hypothetical protein [Sulfurimonas marina]|uniref:Uncharacterized protein n=1 Tax=Sulfurimonas marina TaxID=2590551 RepID=A0A7M1AUC2_9BACT|nr:hypothetical protein [Sulfurimonas marina]QOP41023.1 hypothetical protein FJR03_04390 [Sulfurimonas marina]